MRESEKGCDFGEDWMSQGKAVGAFVVIPFVIGMGGIAMVARSPEFSAIRSVDMLQLIASGMCLGVSLTWIIRVLRGPGVS